MGLKSPGIRESTSILLSDNPTTNRPLAGFEELLENHVELDFYYGPRTVAQQMNDKQEKIRTSAEKGAIEPRNDERKNSDENKKRATTL